MGVNAASLVRYYLRATRRRVTDLLVPLCGFLVCLALWLSLNPYSKLAGVIWMVLGVGFAAVRTRGFRDSLTLFEVPAEK
jgi:putrescine importer